MGFFKSVVKAVTAPAKAVVKAVAPVVKPVVKAVTAPAKAVVKVAAPIVKKAVAVSPVAAVVKKFSHGGSASSRADGIAQKGRTRGKII